MVCILKTCPWEADFSPGGREDETRRQVTHWVIFCIVQNEMCPVYASRADIKPSSIQKLETNNKACNIESFVQYAGPLATG